MRLLIFLLEILIPAWSSSSPAFPTMYTAYKLNMQGNNVQPRHTIIPIFEPVHYSMSCSNCCFLICIQVSQEVGKVLWYPHLFKNFPQFVVIHTVKGLIVTESVNNQCSFFFFFFSWNALAFSMIQQMLAFWPLFHSKRSDHGNQSHPFMANRWGEKWKQWQTLFFQAPKSLQTVTAAMKLKHETAY